MPPGRACIGRRDDAVEGFRTVFPRRSENHPAAPPARTLTIYALFAVSLQSGSGGLHPIPVRTRWLKNMDDRDVRCAEVAEAALTAGASAVAGRKGKTEVARRLRDGISRASCSTMDEQQAGFPVVGKTSSRHAMGKNFPTRNKKWQDITRFHPDIVLPCLLLFYMGTFSCTRYLLFLMCCAALRLSSVLVLTACFPDPG